MKAKVSVLPDDQHLQTQGVAWLTGVHFGDDRYHIGSHNMPSTSTPVCTEGCLNKWSEKEWKQLGKSGSTFCPEQSAGNSTSPDTVVPIDRT